MSERLIRLRRPRSMADAVIAYAVALHVIWGSALLLSSRPLRPTPLGPVSHVPHRLVGLLLLGAAGLALRAALRPMTPVPDALALVPQQLLLVLSAVGSAGAIIAGHYADGVPRPHLFILIDQTPAVLTAIWHTWAVVHHATRR